MHFASDTSAPFRVLKLFEVVAGLEYTRQHGTKSGKSVGRPNVVLGRDE
jgi:hypothetical protein